MIALLIATHGLFGDELLKSAAGLLGPTADTAALAFMPSQGKEDLVGMMGTARARFESKKLLILVDLVGGTPFNAAMMLAAADQAEVLSGVSLPMLVDALSLRQQASSPQDLARLLKEKTASYAVSASDLLGEKGV